MAARHARRPRTLLSCAWGLVFAVTIPAWTACSGTVTVEGENGGTVLGGLGECQPASMGPDENGNYQRLECFESQDATCPDQYDATMYIPISMPCSYLKSIDCGPVRDGSACCYLATEEPGACP